MGKQLGPIQYSGKIANIVGMKGEDGENYVRTKVTPRNPNTAAQVAARVKMSLAGLLSQMTPKAAIYGMGTSSRKRRSAFTGNIARMAEASQNGDAIVATLAPADLIFSKGVGRNLSDVLSATFLNGTLTVTASALPTDLAAIEIVAVFSENRTGDYHAVEVKTITGTTLSVTFTSSDQVANVYYIPVMQADGASRASYERAVENIEASSSYQAQAEYLTSGVFANGASAYLNSYSNTQG